MSNVIYDFYSEVFEYRMMLGVLFIISIAVFVFACFILPNQIVQIDGVERKIKELDVLSRLFVQGIPVGVSLVLVLFSGVNCINYLLFTYDYSVGDYEEITGPLSNVTVVQNDSRGEELYNIEFSVADVFFSTQNSYSVEQKAFFTDGQQVTIRYGYFGQEMTIYRIVVHMTGIDSGP